MIRFNVYGIPQPKGSTKSFMVEDKTTHKLKVITTSDNKNLKSWHQMVNTAAQEHRPGPGGGLLSGPVEIVLTFYLLRPKSVSERRRPLPVVKPDLDKLTRAVLDALKGKIYADDSQVVGLDVRKYYGNPPCVEITVKEVVANGLLFAE